MTILGGTLRGRSLDLEEEINSRTGRDSGQHGNGKRYFKIDQHLARHFNYNGAHLSSPLPYICSQIISNYHLFLIQWFPPTVESVYPYSCSSVGFLL